MPDIVQATLHVELGFVVVSFYEQVCFEFSLKCVSSCTFFDTVWKSIP